MEGDLGAVGVEGRSASQNPAAMGTQLATHNILHASAQSYAELLCFGGFHPQRMPVLVSHRLAALSPELAPMLPDLSRTKRPN